MAKEVTPVRLSPEWKAFANRRGLTMTQLIEMALLFYKEKTEPFIVNHMEIYRAVGKAIEDLEVKRDYGPEGFQGGEGIEPPALSEEENLAHQIYNKYWDELRTHPFFIDPDLFTEDL